MSFVCSSSQSIEPSPSSQGSSRRSSPAVVIPTLQDPPIPSAAVDPFTASLSPEPLLLKRTSRHELLSLLRSAHLDNLHSWCVMFQLHILARLVIRQLFLLMNFGKVILIIPHLALMVFVSLHIKYAPAPSLQTDCYMTYYKKFSMKILHKILNVRAVN
jgi:hypothetical protein